jgi:ribosomal protein L28
MAKMSAMTLATNSGKFPVMASSPNIKDCVIYTVMLHCFRVQRNALFQYFTPLMSRSCNLCGRNALNANSRSHSNIATSVRRNVNLQTLYLKGKRVAACTSCIRSETKRLKSLTEKPVKKVVQAAAVPAK